ncbi:PepSY domain-containing protein [Sphingoaurantiacus capsulatus]|uniref:PepSY domain-containing protein n=1 Tax=Sphingoaurantiacus capsulatus TaxID=1771310 RepID=A0ABV7XBQ3_9SPHN
MIRPLLLAIATATVLASGPAGAQYRDQDEAYKAARSGEIRPLGEIIARVTPKVRGSFVGSDFDAGTRTYRLKYMREGSLVVVDVDASTGRVLGMSGK